MYPERVETQADYIAHLKEEGGEDSTYILRFVNKQTGPIDLQIEPTGDMATDLEPDDFYEVVIRRYGEGPTIIDIHTNGVSVWVDEGRVFHKGVCVAY